jgi:hypothetical protein
MFFIVLLRTPEYGGYTIRNRDGEVREFETRKEATAAAEFAQTLFDEDKDKYEFLVESCSGKARKPGFSKKPGYVGIEALWAGGGH